MPYHVEHDILRATYTYTCLGCGAVTLTLTEAQILQANHIMDLMPTEPHTCPPKEEAHMAPDPEAAMCPSCGYSGLTLVEGNILKCTTPPCTYQHMVTTTMPVIVVNNTEPD